jgi:hypothetical protein
MNISKFVRIALVAVTVSSPAVAATDEAQQAAPQMPMMGPGMMGPGMMGPGMMGQGMMMSPEQMQQMREMMASGQYPHMQMMHGMNPMGYMQGQQQPGMPMMGPGMMAPGMMGPGMMNQGMMPQHMMQMMQMRMQHMANMEQRLQNIEALLKELVELQKAQ